MLLNLLWKSLLCTARLQNHEGGMFACIHYYLAQFQNNEEEEEYGRNEIILYNLKSSSDTLWWNISLSFYFMMIEVYSTREYAPAPLFNLLPKQESLHWTLVRPYLYWPKILALCRCCYCWNPMKKKNCWTVTVEIQTFQNFFKHVIELDLFVKSCSGWPEPVK